MTTVDWLYLLGVSVTWMGVAAQIVRMLRIKDANAISMWWPLALLISIFIRIPRAATATEYPVWIVAYVVSAIVVVVLIVVAAYLKLRRDSDG